MKNRDPQNNHCNTYRIKTNINHNHQIRFHFYHHIALYLQQFHLHIEFSKLHQLNTNRTLSIQHTYLRDTYHTLINKNIRNYSIHHKEYYFDHHNLLHMRQCHLHTLKYIKNNDNSCYHNPKYIHIHQCQQYMLQYYQQLSKYSL